MRPVVVLVPARLSPPQSEVLHARLERLLDAGLPVVCRLGEDVDLPALQLVARVRLLARRLGAPLEVRAATPGLLELTGLGQALGVSVEADAGPEPTVR